MSVTLNGYKTELCQYNIIETNSGYILYYCKKTHLFIVETINVTIKSNGLHKNCSRF